MNVDLFEFEMKKAGYRTPRQRANILGLSLSAYYRRINKKCEFSKKQMDRVASIVGRDVMMTIFFG